MSNNQKSRFDEVMEYFESSSLREATAAYGCVENILAKRSIEAGIAEKPRRGRRPGSKNRPAEDPAAYSPGGIPRLAAD